MVEERHEGLRQRMESAEKQISLNSYNVQLCLDTKFDIQ